MKTTKCSTSQITGLFKFNTISALLLTVGILLINLENGVASDDLSKLILSQSGKTIEGLSGGSTNSQGCGFIADSPSYKMNLSQKIDYMRLTVEATGGQPTLLVIGPNSGDSFCVLGDGTSGLKPEISGVWEAGYYQIYVGDRTQSRHKFVLDISTNN
ncbi:hypothetical protein C7B62_12575 [Pleurocapsa sp. CCALA 161]|uniref:hypothetical protein n=1 Tax=Pleurocapsa sp. CCALA 161 TaxID=2107688 RepID=UPI000D05D89C|nr:hypothetical protein [Pleurocapsa sp. CCALA 161]PSB09617.1 hypothetical protein C7B62_12575 [Pleurocapsa sp. CCALA 161]